MRRFALFLAILSLVLTACGGATAAAHREGDPIRPGEHHLLALGGGLG